MVNYRTLQPQEEDAVLDLWVETLDGDRTARRQLFSDFRDDAQRFQRTQVAIAEDGSLLAASSYWVRELRDAAGSPCRCGHLWGVATRPEARRQGHASQLLHMALAAMRAEGCYWSILFAREEARSLYAKAGWQEVAARYRGGPVTGQRPSPSSAYIVQAYDPATESNEWDALAAVYTSYNAKRPLTLIRDRPYWHGYVAWMLRDWINHHRAQLLVTYRADQPSKVCGYVVAHFYNADYAQRQFGSPPWFFMSEIGALPEEREAVDALILEVVQRAAQQGMGYGRFDLALDPQGDAAVQAIWGTTLEEHTEPGTMMIRPLVQDPGSWPNLAPNAHFWSIDRY